MLNVSKQTSLICKQKVVVAGNSGDLMQQRSNSFDLHAIMTYAAKNRRKEKQPKHTRKHTHPTNPFRCFRNSTPRCYDTDFLRKGWVIHALNEPHQGHDFSHQSGCCFSRRSWRFLKVTVDGSDIRLTKTHLGWWVLNPVNNGSSTTDPSTGERRISAINSRTVFFPLAPKSAPNVVP